MRSIIIEVLEEMEVEYCSYSPCPIDDGDTDITCAECIADRIMERLRPVYKVGDISKEEKPQFFESDNTVTVTTPTFKECCEALESCDCVSIPCWYPINIKPVEI